MIPGTRVRDAVDVVLGEANLNAGFLAAGLLAGAPREQRR